jgi:hypothetical protein
MFLLGSTWSFEFRFSNHGMVYITSIPSEPKSSFHPLLKPKISPGTNPKPAAMGDPEVAIVEECVANSDAVVCIRESTKSRQLSGRDSEKRKAEPALDVTTHIAKNSWK